MRNGIGSITPAAGLTVLSTLLASRTPSASQVLFSVSSRAYKAYKFVVSTTDRQHHMSLICRVCRRLWLFPSCGMALPGVHRADCPSISSLPATRASHQCLARKHCYCRGKRMLHMTPASHQKKRVRLVQVPCFPPKG